MDRDEYRNVYLRSEHWLAVRKAALERAEHRCQVCNDKQQLDVHHRTYERLGEELDSDLTVLCRRCHDLFHASKPKAAKPSKRKTKAARRKERNKKANPPSPRPIYVSPADRERLDKMREAELERRRADKRARDARRDEVKQRRLAKARSGRDWRDEQALPNRYYGRSA